MAVKIMTKPGEFSDFTEREIRDFVRRAHVALLKLVVARSKAEFHERSGIKLDDDVIFTDLEGKGAEKRGILDGFYVVEGLNEDTPFESLLILAKVRVRDARYPVKFEHLKKASP